MNTIKITFLTVIGFLLFSCSTEMKEKQSSQETENNKDNYISVYDFHNAHRCVTCIAIEKATKEVLNADFKEEMENGTIVFELFNCEAEENQKLAEEYNAYGTTLAITVYKNGQKEIKDLTNWAFKSVKGDSFKEEFKKEMNDALSKLSTAND